MGTRGFIGRPALYIDEVPVGRYHHWDSYPTALGQTLFLLINGHFKGDIESALRVLLDEHPAGWSTINGKDFTLAPGYSGLNFNTFERKDGTLDWDAYYASPENLRPQCYCHGSRSEEAWDLPLNKAAGSGCEYAYIISPETRSMHVLSSYRGDGTKMVGFFGLGDADADWRLLATVDLDGPEPNWDKVEGRDDE